MSDVQRLDKETQMDLLEFEMLKAAGVDNWPGYESDMMDEFFDYKNYFMSHDGDDCLSFEEWCEAQELND